MNITPWTIYWITRLSYISDICTFIGVLVGIITVILGVILFAKRMDNCDTDDVDYKIPCKVTKSLGVAFTILMSIAIFTPSTKEMAAIIVVPEIVNSEKVQTIGNEMYDLALSWMKQLNPELNPDIVNENKSKK